MEHGFISFVKANIHHFMGMSSIISPFGKGGNSAHRWRPCDRIHSLSSDNRLPDYLTMVLKRTRNTLMAPGPRITINMHGKMKKARGTSILTGSFAAISSALCALLVLNESEYTLSAWAMLVPNFSVWISNVTRLLTSSTSVRSERFFNASRFAL